MQGPEHLPVASDQQLARSASVALLRSELRLGLPLSHAVATRERLPKLIQATLRGGLSGRINKVLKPHPAHRHGSGCLPGGSEARETR
jgi:hypothetical protein